jgi:hypothetical protein
MLGKELKKEVEAGRIGTAERASCVSTGGTPLPLADGTSEGACYLSSSLAPFA